MTKSYYDVLEVPKDASETDIKKAFRRLSLQYHPDRNSEANAESKFKEINEAHEILSDNSKRQQYDMESNGHPFFGGGGGMGGPPGAEFHDMNDLLRQMFGGGGMGGPPGGVNFGGIPGAGDFNVFFGGIITGLIASLCFVWLEKIFSNCKFQKRYKYLNSISKDKYDWVAYDMKKEDGRIREDDPNGSTVNISVKKNSINLTLKQKDGVAKSCLILDLHCQV